MKILDRFVYYAEDGPQRRLIKELHDNPDCLKAIESENQSAYIEAHYGRDGCRPRLKFAGVAW